MSHRVAAKNFVWDSRRGIATARVLTQLGFDHGVSVDAMLQQPADAASKQAELIILTHAAREGVMNQAMAKIQNLPTVLAPLVRLRKEDFS